MRNDKAHESFLSRRARERNEDREAGRPERGLFTGRGRAFSNKTESSGRASNDEYDDDDIDDLDDDMDDDIDMRTRRPRPRTGAKRTLMGAIRHIPAYLRLLLGLMGDGRVSRVDRFFVIAAVAYIVSPLDFIPDIIPFFGEADDIFLLVLALQRLIDNTGRRVLMDHWKGDPDDLSETSLTSLVSAAGFFLPAGIRDRLQRMARRSR